MSDCLFRNSKSKVSRGGFRSPSVRH